MNEQVMETEPVGKLFVSLAVPSVISQIVNLLYSAVDRMYVGHIPRNGTTALTALGVCVPIITLVSSFAQQRRGSSGFHISGKRAETTRRTDSGKFLLGHGSYVHFSDRSSALLHRAHSDHIWHKQRNHALCGVLSAHLCLRNHICAADTGA